MKLEKFIELLKKIEENNGDSIKVIMADCIPVIEPILSLDRYGKKCVVITDQKIIEK